MTTDAHLLTLLRSAIRPIATTEPSRDLWPLVVERSQRQERWSWLDVALAGAVAVVLLIRPDLLVLLTYYF